MCLATKLNARRLGIQIQCRVCLQCRMCSSIVRWDNEAVVFEMGTDTRPNAANVEKIATAAKSIGSTAKRIQRGQRELIVQCSPATAIGVKSRWPSVF